MDRFAKLYYDPLTGFKGASTMYKRAKAANIKVTMKQIKEFIKNTKGKQLHSLAKSKNKTGSILGYSPNNVWQADLLDVSRFARANKGYNFILTAIDVYSRKAHAIPLKRKTGKAVQQAFESIFGTNRPNNITTDAGKEFLNKTVQDYFNFYQIRHWVVEDREHRHRKTAVVESFNRTLMNTLKLYFEANDTLNFTKPLQKVVDNYNNTTHSTVKNKPNEIWERKKKNEQVIHTFQSDLKIGDKVRTRIGKGKLSKGFDINYSRDVKTIVRREGQQYVLQTKSGKELKTRYKPDDLKKIVVTHEKKIHQTRSRKKLIKPKDNSKLLAAKRKKRFMRKTGLV